MRKINLHIIHCADTPDGKNFTVEQIRKWHTSPDPLDPSKPWLDIGYHYVIYRNGELHEGRRIEIKGSHCGPKNTGSIGTCLIGRTRFTKAQFDTLKVLHYDLIERFGNIDIGGHRDFDKRKTCPNFDVTEWWESSRMKRSLKDKKIPLKLGWFDQVINLIKSFFNKKEK